LRGHQGVADPACCSKGSSIWRVWKEDFFFNHKLFYLVNLFFFFFPLLRYELRASPLIGRRSTTWATPPALFCVAYFWDRVSRTICLGCLWTEMHLICASCAARITGVSHWRLLNLESHPFIA
jgi:hypothetical protein